MLNHQLKQIGNALRWSTLLISLFLISGCASFWPFNSKSEVKEIQIQKKEVERTRLNLPEPSPLKAREFTWVVVTPENIESVWQKLKDQNVDLVLFALTDDGYQELAMTMAEVRNYIASQKAIIIKYKEYYEPAKTPVTQ
jgi:hypothetical protein